MNIYPLTTHARMLQLGDSASYSYSGTMTPTGGTPAPVSGTDIHTVTAKSGNLLTITHVLKINIYGQSNTVTQWETETQNPDGSGAEVSDNGGANMSVRTVTSNTFNSPGSITGPITITGNTAYSNGNTVANSVTITGSKEIDTSVGVFDAWAESGTAQTNYGYSTVSTTYVDPELGFFVEQDGNGYVAGRWRGERAFYAYCDKRCFIAIMCAEAVHRILNL